jgi:hypothetical protein
MLDRHIAPLIKPAVEQLAQVLVKRSVRADPITLAAFAIGIIAMICIALRAHSAAAILILASRICDALDGAVARQTEATDADGFLDFAWIFCSTQASCSPLHLQCPRRMLCLPPFC